jgi:hypothetical protein
MSLLKDNINVPAKKIYYSYVSEEHMTFWRGTWKTGNRGQLTMDLFRLNYDYIAALTGHTVS